jgi:hypothetical protein
MQVSRENRVTPDAANQAGDQLVGTWKLTGASSTTSASEIIETPYGVGPTGFLTYTAGGRVSSVISYGGRKPLSMGRRKKRETGGSVQDLSGLSGPLHPERRQGHPSHRNLFDSELRRPRSDPHHQVRRRPNHTDYTDHAREREDPDLRVGMAAAAGRIL